MFRSLCKLYPVDQDYPLRTWTLQRRRQVLDGTIYDVLDHSFAEEFINGEYVPISKRRPSARYNLCGLVVEDSVSMLFGDGRFPSLHCADEAARLALAAMVNETMLADVMADAALRGSVGSVAVRFRVLSKRVFFDVIDTDYLTPVWKASAPDTLERVIERYKLRGTDLIAMGYAIKKEDENASFWFQRIWTESAEEWYSPVKAGRVAPGETPQVHVLDAEKTQVHNIGFVPMVWIKNLPGKPGIDGACTFERGIASQIEMEYQLSQAGRGLKYSSDPLLVIREPAGSDNTLVRTASNAVVVDEKGDAKLLEIDGTAAEAVVSYVRTLREFALEVMRGNRGTPDKMGMAQSGRALELLHEAIIWLAGQMRGPYGNALLRLVNMVVRASREMEITIGGVTAKFPDDISVTLRWGHWFPPTHHDNLEEAQALSHAAQAGHISRNSAVILTCDRYDLPDAPAELVAIEADIAAADARAIALAAQTKATETLPD